ncbi:MAG: DUF1460 domain-containing protein [Bacteroidetes bacterium]|nr:DUF1460 domain-containing protein [Bacteroidota bacterium]
MNRREFLSTCSLLFVSIRSRGTLSFLHFFNDVTKTIIEEKFLYAQRNNLVVHALPNALLEIAKTFIGTPYKANTLERPNHEELVIDLTGVDCVTLYEYALAFARCIKKETPTYNAFCREVEFIRYRNGIRDGYVSRLHYTSDYFFDNERKKVLNDVTRLLGGVPFRKHIHYMTSHRHQYPQLKDEQTFQALRNVEKAISQRSLYHVPKHRVQNIAHKIQNGDIVAITTTRPGLDCKHTGIAMWVNNNVHILHAPSVGKIVEVTKEPLWKYLLHSTDTAGIMVARPQEV